MNSLEDVNEEVLNNKKIIAENPMLTLEELFSRVNESWHYRNIYNPENGKFEEFDNVHEIRWRLRHLAVFAILWMDKLEKEIKSENSKGD